MKKVVFAFGLMTVAAVGIAQFASSVVAAPPIVDCSAVLCLPCPDGYVHAPTPGNCCRCVRAK